MALEPEKKATVIVMIITAGIIVLGGGAIYYLKFMVLSDKYDELTKLKSQVDDLAKNKEDIIKIKERLEGKKPELEIVEKQIPLFGETEYDRFMNQLDDVRIASNVLFSQAKIIPPQKTAPVAGIKEKEIPKNIHTINYDLTILGDFFNLLKFITLLENDERFILIKSVSITGGSMMKLTITTYSYKTPQTPGKSPKKEEYSISTPIVE